MKEVVNRPQQHLQNEHFSKLMWMATLSMVFMYVLLYYALDNLEPDIDASFIAAILTLPVVIIEVILMGGMQRTKITIVLMVVVCILVFLTFHFVVTQRLHDALTAVAENQ